MPKTIAVAESCTGGLLGSLLTDTPGASKYFLGGVIAYQNLVKQILLGVPSHILRKHGAVSKETAIRMAIGVQKKFKVRVGVAITGIAGPAGGTKEKPVGLVYIALVSGQKKKCERSLFSGNRSAIRKRAAKTAYAWAKKEIF